MTKKSENKIEKQLSFEGSETALGDMQYEVLTHMSAKRFEEAAQSLQKFAQKKNSYPNYKKKTERFFNQSVDLVKAIETKMGFPNLSALPPSKQEEIFQKIEENWQDLKLSLRRVKGIEKDLRDADARSSIYVVKAIFFSAIFLLAVFIFNEAHRVFGNSVTGFMKESQEIFFEMMDK